MLKNNKINNKNFYFYLVLFFLIIVFLIRLDFFKQLYLLSTNKFNQRMINNYGYCGNDSYGFLKDIKKKFKPKKNLKIINYKVMPNSSWITFEAKKEFEDVPTVFLNYPENISLNFFPESQIFRSKGHVQFTEKIKSISFNTGEKRLNLNHELIIFKLKDGKKEILFKRLIKRQIKNNDLINVNFLTQALNSRWHDFFLQIKNLDSAENNKIKSITFNFKNKYEFSKEDILFNVGNCFYIK